VIPRFNDRVRQHRGDQTYKNYDLESSLGHNQV
jgi:hypothetical protein